MSNSKYFFVDAKATKSKWQNTNITVDEGDSITITCLGKALSVYLNNTDKHNIDTANNLNMEDPDSFDPSLDANSVIAKIADGSTVEIGTSGVLKASSKGSLYLASNDIITKNTDGFFAIIDSKN